jgi:hypothetical protein
MGILRINTKAFTIAELFFVVAGITIIAITGFSIIHKRHVETGVRATAHTTTPMNTVSASNPYAVLTPATVASKTAECSQTLVYSSDGNSGPVTCANGDLNVLEWNGLAALEPTVMTLGYGATVAQIQAALCKDAADSDSDANSNASSIIEATTYQISALYYGWNFSPSPSAVLSDGGC